MATSLPTTTTLCNRMKSPSTNPSSLFFNASLQLLPSALPCISHSLTFSSPARTLPTLIPSPRSANSSPFYVPHSCLSPLSPHSSNSSPSFSSSTPFLHKTLSTAPSTEFLSNRQPTMTANTLQTPFPFPKIRRRRRLFLIPAHPKLLHLRLRSCDPSKLASTSLCSTSSLTLPQVLHRLFLPRLGR